MQSRALLFFCSLFLATQLNAETVSYEFEISTHTVNITGKSVDALAIDGQIPAPTIRAKVGDTLRVTFHNTLDTATSVHWHGILLPADQDGVSYLNTRPISAGQSHTFEFPITHAGTFWYHSHTGFQIQQGLYGAIVLEETTPTLMQEEVVLLSDWTDSPVHRILQNLKSDSEFYAFQRDNVQSWDRVIANGPEAIRNRISSAYTRMGPMDLADVYYDAFLANGKKESRVTLIDSTATEIKLRIINGSTSSYFDVDYAGGPMTIIAADGQNVEPIKVNRLRIATAETYDVLVAVESGKAFELRANSFDGSGYSSTYLGEGVPVRTADMDKPNLFLMDHSMMEHHSSAHEEVDHTAMNHTAPSPEPMEHTPSPSDAQTSDPHAGHTMPMPVTENAHDHGAVQDHSNHVMPAAVVTEDNVIEHMTDYSALRALTATGLPAGQNWRNIDLTLTGSMERYTWSFDGKTFRESPQILIRKGENVRLSFTNDTMMHHPLHLHGHFFRVINGGGESSPLKHTVDVPPMGSVVIEFDANEEQDWMFHCHNQYHMKSGMNRVMSYEGTSIFDAEIEKKLQPMQRFYQVHEFHLMTSFADYEFGIFDDRHEFRLELESDVAGEEEVLTTYSYHFSRFLSAFAGYQEREHEIEKNRDAAIVGINLTLPFLIDSEWRVNDNGELRLELESSIALTKHWNFDWRINSDHEYRYGINYRLNNRWSVTAHKDKEYGSGVGIKFFY